MKLFHRCTALLAAAAAAVIGSLPAAASSSQDPVIVVADTGIEDTYKITVENWNDVAWGQDCYSVQFDVRINQALDSCQMDWTDNGTNTFHEIKKDQDGSGTILTFYYDRQEPISNGSSALIGTLTAEGIENADISTSGDMTVVLGRELRPYRYDNVGIKRKSYTKPQTSESSSRRDEDSGSGDRGSASPAALKWDDVKDQIKEADGKKTLELDMSEDPRLSVTILRNLLQNGLTAVLDYGHYQWIVDGSTVGDMPANRIYYDLSVQAISLQNVSLATENTDILQFEIAHDGELPFAALLRYRLGTQYAGRTVYLACYDEQSGRLEYRASAVVDEAGYVELEFRHASKYVVTTADLWNAEEAAEAAASMPAVVVPPLNSPEQGQLQNNLTASQPPETENIPAEGGPGTENSQPEELAADAAVNQPLEDFGGKESKAPAPAERADKASTFVAAALFVIVLLAASGIFVFMAFQNKKTGKRK